MLGFYAAFYACSKYTWPDYNFTTVSDRENIVKAINEPFGFEDPCGKDVWKVFVAYFFQASISISAVVTTMFFILYALNKEKTYTTTLWRQLPDIVLNCALFLPIVDAVTTYFVYRGWFKIFVSEPPYDAGSFAVLYHLRDMSLWLLVFELSWYMQHRAMHDNKTLWKLGHEYHHQWRKPEHMIGITNFAFDHIVEVWVTMSSSYAPMLFFPIHMWAFRIVGFLYMMLAVLVHWDAFPMRYHLNHHYCVIKNYGSHIPLFDIFFGTYQWGSFFPANIEEQYPGFKPGYVEENEKQESKKES